jgi:hypothetical protein
VSAALLPYRGFRRIPRGTCRAAFQIGANFLHIFHTQRVHRPFVQVLHDTRCFANFVNESHHCILIFKKGVHGVRVKWPRIRHGTVYFCVARVFAYVERG